MGNNRLNGITLTNVMDRLKERIDEVSLLEILDISSEEIVDRFQDRIEERFEMLREELFEEFDDSDMDIIREDD
jgi:hypothetical protein